MPLSVAYLTKHVMPSTDVATVQIVHTTSALVRAGVAIDLFLPVPWGERKRDPEELRRELRGQYGAECGFNLHPLPTRIPGPRLLSQALQELASAVGTGRGGYDALYSRDEANILLGLARGNRVLFESYRTPQGFKRPVRWLIRRAYDRPRFLGQITHSRFARDRYLAAGYPAEKVRAIYNGFDASAFPPERSPAEARRKLHLPERPTVGYAGRIAPMKRIDLLLDAAARTPGLHWVLAGPRDTREAAPFVARGAGMPNVTFLGYLSGDALAAALQAADLLVIPPSAEPLERFGTTVLPIKVFPYLAAGRPLVVGEVADTVELLEDGVTALRVPPDDVAAFVAAIGALMADPARRARMGAAGRDLAKGLTWDARAVRIREFLEERLAAAGDR